MVPRPDSAGFDSGKEKMGADEGAQRRGIGRGLTNYGDPAFSLYLRRSFARSMGYSDEMLGRPIVVV